jgi:hypothetical protein
VQVVTRLPGVGPSQLPLLDDKILPMQPPSAFLQSLTILPGISTSGA